VTIRRRVLVHGLAQGVFFRETTRRRAEGAGVTRWVANRRDGTVEAVFEGDPEGVERLVRYCEQGPRGAIVERVEVTVEQPEGSAGFSVR